MEHIYFDYAATTSVDPMVLRAMQPYFTEKFGNPGSLHSFGQEAIAALDKSRETIAKSIGAEFREVIFTSSATEANNLALRGAVEGAMSYELGGTRHFKSILTPSSKLVPRIIVSSIEHESILETARALEKDGVEVVYLPVDKNGVVDLKKLKASLDERTVLVSIMYANNEIGVIQPIAEIAKIIDDFRVTSRKPLVFHVDASQAFQFLDCNVKNLGVDLMTLSSHKIYGPKGVGVLYVRGAMSYELGGTRHFKSILTPSSKLVPLLHGGGQEYGLRSGTENVPAIVGFAKAIELADAARKKESKRIATLRDQLWRGIKRINSKAELNVSYLLAPSSYLPNLLNVYFPGHQAQDLLTKFDLAGLAVSSGSACRSRAMESSYVLEALGYSRERAKSSIRFSLGRPTTKQEIDQALKILSSILNG
jgi:cysteine desulfurase